MKNLLLTTLSILCALNIYAQSPETISYQAILRNSTNQLVSNQSVSMRLSILSGSISGTAVYVETHSPTTNVNGLITVQIGNGNVVSGSLSTVDWGNGPFFIKTETDPNGGSNYTILGTSQLLSVPYALHAKTADSLSGSINETDPIFNGSIASGISASDTAYWNNKLSSYTETDPIYSNSVAASIGTADTAYWNAKLDSYTESDPIFGSSQAASITSTDISNWNNKLSSYTETDPVYNASVAASIGTTDTAYWNAKLDSYTESDPIFGSSQAAGITSTDISNWNNKLSSYTETDPIYNASLAASIGTTDTAYWNAKLDSYTESDPVYNASVAANIGTTDTAYWNAKLDSYSESDPLFNSSLAASITTSDTLRWGIGGDNDWTINGNDQYSAVSGLVGIGTTTPDNKLDVFGKISLTQSPGNEMVIINDNQWTHGSGVQDFGIGGAHFIMASRETDYESAGIYGDGNVLTLWSPGDANNGQPSALIYVCDEDRFDGITDNNPHNNNALYAYLNTAGNWVAPSDINRKENIQELESVLEKLLKINGYSYNFKLAEVEVAKGDKIQTTYGVIAQEVIKEFPEIVDVSEDGLHYVSYTELIPLLLEGMQEQQLMIDQLQAENEALETRLRSIEEKLNKAGL